MYIFTTKGFEDKCPVCSFRVSDFITEQRLGCAFCYLFLKKPLQNLIQAVQDGEIKHLGKKGENTHDLLHQFFDFVLDERAAIDVSNKENFNTIKNILKSYF